MSLVGPSRVERARTEPGRLQRPRVPARLRPRKCTSRRTRSTRGEETFYANGESNPEVLREETSATMESLLHSTGAAAGNRTRILGLATRDSALEPPPRRTEPPSGVAPDPRPLREGAPATGGRQGERREAPGPLAAPYQRFTLSIAPPK